MIGRLGGILLEKQPPQVLIDVNGVGYEVDVSMTTFYQLPALGEATVLFIHQIVREDANLLYGFASRSERTTFCQLLKINGIGARIALAILSGMNADELAHAVATEDLKRLSAVPGIGKKTAARLVLERAGDLAALLTNLEPHDVLFIDEIHRLSPVVEEILYPALEDYQIDIMIGEGPAARSVKIDLPPFTLIGATTRAGMLTNPLRDRFGIVSRLEFYTPTELTLIVQRSAGLLNVTLDPEGAFEIARRSRGTPRIVNRLLRRVRDYAEVRADGQVSAGVADAALSMLDVDLAGLDVMDRKLLSAVLEKFAGGPVGLDNVAAAIGESTDTIEDVIEPYLIQQGYLQRTPRGRVATALAYTHFGLPQQEQDKRR